ncbi:nitroreductase family deazaflavin-dependent oxidoreductase [Nocardia sp. NPDC004568]|uniref:nitroreductase family deazaflavin-dependent oxidoreductase n=1 Tax=Nocardia sp. NPDC004568 TaxID=3154551 RepID=UPI0033A1CC4D
MTGTGAALPHYFPRWIDRFGVRFVNPWMRRIAPSLPGYAVIEHTGRNSGTRYETPICIFRRGSTVAVVLLHGETDWARNAVAAGHARLRCRDGILGVRAPRVVPPRAATAEVARLARLGNRVAGIIVFDID